jgi:hypothetical protein
VDDIRFEKKWLGVSAAIGCLEGLSFALKGDPSFMLFWVIIVTFIAMGLWFALRNRRIGSGDGLIETASIGFLLSVMIAELGFAAGVLVSLWFA